MASLRVGDMLDAATRHVIDWGGAGRRARRRQRSAWLTAVAQPAPAILRVPRRTSPRARRGVDSPKSNLFAGSGPSPLSLVRGWRMPSSADATEPALGAAAAADDVTCLLVRATAAPASLRLVNVVDSVVERSFVCRPNCVGRAIGNSVIRSSWWGDALVDVLTTMSWTQVIMHERAHLMRYDDWSSLLQALIASVRRPHPARLGT